MQQRGYGTKSAIRRRVEYCYGVVMHQPRYHHFCVLSRGTELPGQAHPTTSFLALLTFPLQLRSSHPRYEGVAGFADSALGRPKRDTPGPCSANTTICPDRGSCFVDTTGSRTRSPPFHKRAR